MIGQLLDGRYKVIQTLGTGGFGQTYIAENTRLPGSPKCVIKQLKPASTDPNTFAIAKRLFESEAAALVQLGNHSQIPRITDFFAENQEFYLVQDLIEGHTLTKELAPGKKLDEAYVIALLKDVLPILEFVHQQNTIHRDIKPDNIIRRRQDNKLVLIDFGAVKQQVQAGATAVENQQSVNSVAIGTPGYMPTEQARGKPRPSSDIYALGMIGIQALTGLYPNKLEEDSQTGEIVWQHLASVSSGLAEVLTKMTHYHFKDRYQSATEVLQALEQLENQSSAQTSRYQKTEAVTQVDTDVYELTLEWIEAGQTKTRIISEQQVSKNPGTVRIGRDPAQCDIVLSEPTVSGLHVEIFFNQQQKRFYVRSLRQSNPPVVDGKTLQTGEVELNQGSNLRLGQLSMRVTGITLNHYPAGYVPTAYVTQSNTQSYPVQPTVKPIKGDDIELTLEILSNEAAVGAVKEITFNRTVYINGNRTQETKKLMANIPAGSQDGARLQLPGQGNEGLYGGSAGDVYVRLIVKAQPPVPVSPTPTPAPIPPQPSKSKFPAWLAKGLVTGTVLLVGAFIRANWNSGTVSNNSTSNNSVSTEQCVVVTGKNLNIRTTPNGQTTGKLVQVGTNVSFTGQEESGWLKISSPVEGWIWKENTTTDCSQAKTPNPDVIESSSNSKSTTQTPPLCANGKPAEWFEGKGRFSCIGQDRDNPQNSVDNPSSVIEKSPTNNSQSVNDCHEANENLSSAQREAKCGCPPGYFYDKERAGCFPT